MNKQELLKQADYTFQRGNCELAKKYLSELLTQYPNEESAWMLMARMVEQKERKVECYENVLRLNPGNKEAELGIARLEAVKNTARKVPWKISQSAIKVLRAVTFTILLVMIFGTTTYVVAMKNPQSSVGKLLIQSTPIPYAQNLSDDIAAQTRAQIGTKYPQYAALVESLIGLAVNNADNGMDGAPERPGAPIVPSEGAAQEAKSTLENALPQPGSLNTVTLTEQQLTSWLAIEMQKRSDLPLKDIQVYLQNGEIQVWCMVEGSKSSTSALISSRVNLSAGISSIELTSIQIGQQVVPGFLLAQAGAWLNELLTQKINEQVPGLQVMNININSGLITISGMR